MCGTILDPLPMCCVTNDALKADYCFKLFKLHLGHILFRCIYILLYLIIVLQLNLKIIISIPKILKNVKIMCLYLVGETSSLSENILFCSSDIFPYFPTDKLGKTLGSIYMGNVFMGTMPGAL